MTTTLKFDFATPGLNGKAGLIRGHWTARKALKKKLQWLIMEQSMHRHQGKVKLTFKRTSPRLMDVVDNLPASLKVLVDAMVANGMIKDDSPNIIPFQPVISQEKGKASMELVIEDIVD